MLTDQVNYGDNPGDQSLIQDGIETAKDLGNTNSNIENSDVIFWKIMKDGVEFVDKQSESLIKAIDNAVDNLIETGKPFVDVLNTIGDALSKLGDNLKDLIFPNDPGAYDPTFDHFMDGLYGSAGEVVCPIVLDLDDNGVAISSVENGVYFDHNGDGFAEKSAWASTTDGLLVRDLNRDGKIDSGAELFGDQTSLKNGKAGVNGFEILAEYDGNHDGKIDARDTLWRDLKVWVDADHDGISDAGELKSLADYRIQSIDVAYNQPGGPGTLATGNYTRTDGTTGHGADDPNFIVESWNTRSLKTLAIPANIAALPNLAGSGTVSSLQQTMARDPGGRLQVLIGQYMKASSLADANSLIEQIVFAWAGSTDVDPHSRDNTTYGTTWDARKLVALERWMGRGLVQPNADSGKTETNPLPQAIPYLEEAWEALTQHMSGLLEYQTVYAADYDAIAFKWNNTTQLFQIDAGGNCFRHPRSVRAHTG